MATWDDVARVALALPAATEGFSYGNRAWKVQDKAFAWERPLGRTDLAALGETAPHGPILAVRVPDVGVQQALVADDPAVYFTIPHFTGYPAVLVRLDVMEPADLDELLVEAWLARAPSRLRKQYLAAIGTGATKRQ